MEAFSQKDYYPIPSDNVITYDGEKNDHSRKRRVLKADLLALIVQLSSPIDTVDYMVISDFFSYTGTLSLLWSFLTCWLCDTGGVSMKSIPRA